MTDDERQENVANREQNVAAHTETRRHFNEVAARIAAENQQHFNEVAARIAAENQHFFATGTERLRHEIQLVAEGVTSTREALSREAADIRDELRRTAPETQAMIKVLARRARSSHQHSRADAEPARRRPH